MDICHSIFRYKLIYLCLLLLVCENSGLFTVATFGGWRGALDSELARDSVQTSATVKPGRDFEGNPEPFHGTNYKPVTNDLRNAPEIRGKENPRSRNKVKGRLFKPIINFIKKVAKDLFQFLFGRRNHVNEMKPNMPWYESPMMSPAYSPKHSETRPLIPTNSEDLSSYTVPVRHVAPVNGQQNGGPVMEHQGSSIPSNSNSFEITSKYKDNKVYRHLQKMIDAQKSDITSDSSHPIGSLSKETHTNLSPISSPSQLTSQLSDKALSNQVPQDAQLVPVRFLPGYLRTENFIAGDGNCLFRAFSYHLFGSQDQHELLRAQMIEHITKNPDHYKNFVALDLEVSDVDAAFEEYCREMAKPKVYGDHISIMAILEMYNRKLIVFSEGAETGSIVLLPKDEVIKDHQWLGLHLKEEHYELLFEDSKKMNTEFTSTNEPKN